MSMDNIKSKEWIHFLKEHYEEYEKELLEVIDSVENGVYFIDDEVVTFSNKAMKLLNVNEQVSIDDFYSLINIQDRQKLIQTLHQQQDKTPYEILYRYKINQEQIIWIKENGIIHSKNKNKRIAIIKDYTKQIEQNEQLYRMAYYDSITKLKNQNYFTQDIKFLIQYKVPFALYLIDVNNFKTINDDFGHLYGDHILKQFAERLKNCLSDIELNVYRLSGDEFSILLPNVKSLKDTDHVLNIILDSFSTPLFFNEFNISISPSIGIAFYPKDSKIYPTLMKYADISLYRAKNDPYRKYSYFDRNYYKAVNEEKAVEDHIHYLIQNQLITLKYQPIYNINTMEIVGYEALLNNNAAFNSEVIFSTALKSQLIVTMEKYIIEKVFHDIAQVQDEIPQHIRFNINLTPKTIEYIDVYQFVKKILDTYHISGERIGFELTEQYYVNDESKLNHLIEQLRSLGIKFYLDDFGMGYSSVRNLAYITYDHIKLDRRIVSTVFTNPKSDFFLKHILQFSKDVHSDIVIEGVEDIEQLNYIRSIGAVYAQGYYLSKPIEMKDVLKLKNTSVNLFY